MDSKHIYKQAQKRVNAKRGFYWHAITSAMVAVFLLFLNLTAAPQWPWFLIPTAALAISVIIHWLAVFGLGNSWEKKQLEKEVRRLQEQQYLLESGEVDDDMLNINEKDYLKLKEKETRENFENWD